MKLIRNPLDCAYHPTCTTLISFRRIKLCLKDETVECNKTFKFPEECPLQDGINLESHNELIKGLSYKSRLK